MKKSILPKIYLFDAAKLEKVAVNTKFLG